jgi:hypothetical protein
MLLRKIIYRAANARQSWPPYGESLPSLQRGCAIVLQLPCLPLTIRLTVATINEPTPDAPDMALRR